MLTTVELMEKNYGFLIERTSKKIKQTLQRRFTAAAIDLTVDQWVLLNRLNHQDSQSQNELAESTYKDAPTVTRIIDLMCEKKLTTRVPHHTDRRRFCIMLTDHGKAVYVQALPIVEQLRQEGLQHIPDADYQVAMQVLAKMYKNLDE